MFSIVVHCTNEKVIIHCLYLHTDVCQCFWPNKQMKWKANCWWCILLVMNVTHIKMCRDKAQKNGNDFICSSSVHWLQQTRLSWFSHFLWKKKNIFFFFSLGDCKNCKGWQAGSGSFEEDRVPSVNLFQEPCIGMMI